MLRETFLSEFYRSFYRMRSIEVFRVMFADDLLTWQIVGEDERGGECVRVRGCVGVNYVVTLADTYAHGHTFSSQLDEARH